MEIIKRGIKEEDRKYEGRCHSCGSVIGAVKSELSQANQANCLVCGSLVSFFIVEFYCIKDSKWEPVLRKPVYVFGTPYYPRGIYE